MQRSFDIEINADPPTKLTVQLTGELDLVARPTVVEQVTSALGGQPGADRVVIDLGGVSFCDSSGLGALLAVQRTAAEQGAAVVLRSVPSTVARVLDMAGVGDVLPQE
jgi:anti-sigma B factor antagonist